jgi:pyridoxal 5'-phosphate synthase pdxS subunit
LEIDYIDESEVLTMADEVHHINKNKFKAPFVCGCRDLGEALRRIAEGATMLRTKVGTFGPSHLNVSSLRLFYFFTKGEAGTGNIVEAVRHARAVMGDIRKVTAMDDDELFVASKDVRK